MSFIYNEIKDLKNYLVVGSVFESIINFYFALLVFMHFFTHFLLIRCMDWFSKMGKKELKVEFAKIDTHARRKFYVKILALHQSL